MSAQQRPFAEAHARRIAEGQARAARALVITDTIGYTVLTDAELMVVLDHLLGHSIAHPKRGRRDPLSVALKEAYDVLKEEEAERFDELNTMPLEGYRHG